MDLKKRRHFIDCHVAGFIYWDGPIVFNELKIGSQLQLKREEDNKFDPYAVALYYGEYKLGFIPRSENEDISKFCEMGYTDIFDVRINRISSQEQPEDQIGIIIYLKKKEN
ncbi:MAG: HIRAN domain-containing protein [Bacteroidales bacterium]|nr:HIRAN domain-containing protein [Bacteroidales bacterium]